MLVLGGPSKFWKNPSVAVEGIRITSNEWQDFPPKLRGLQYLPFLTGRKRQVKLEGFFFSACRGHLPHFSMKFYLEDLGTNEKSVNVIGLARWAEGCEPLQ